MADGKGIFEFETNASQVVAEILAALKKLQSETNKATKGTAQDTRQATRLLPNELAEGVSTQALTELDRINTAAKNGTLNAKELRKAYQDVLTTANKSLGEVLKERQLPVDIAFNFRQEALDRIDQRVKASFKDAFEISANDLGAQLRQLPTPSNRKSDFLSTFNAPSTANPAPLQTPTPAGPSRAPVNAQISAEESAQTQQDIQALRQRDIERRKEFADLIAEDGNFKEGVFKSTTGIIVDAREAIVRLLRDVNGGFEEIEATSNEFAAELQGVLRDPQSRSLSGTVKGVQAEGVQQLQAEKTNAQLENKKYIDAQRALVAAGTLDPSKLTQLNSSTVIDRSQDGSTRVFRAIGDGFEELGQTSEKRLAALRTEETQALAAAARATKAGDQAAAAQAKAVAAQARADQGAAAAAARASAASQSAADRQAKADAAKARQDTAEAQRTALQNLYVGTGKDTTLDAGVTALGGGYFKDIRDGTDRYFQRVGDGIKDITNQADKLSTALSKEITAAQAQASGGRGGVTGGFLHGLLSGGFGGQGTSGLEGLAQSAGTTLKYTGLYSALGAIQTVLSQGVAQTLNFQDSQTNLAIALENTGENAEDAHAGLDDMLNSLSQVSVLAGGNVGDVMDVAARGIRLLGENSDLSKKQIQEFGVEYARQANIMATLAKTTVQDASGNLAAIQSSFDLGPESSNRINDAIVTAKNLGGGDEKETAQALATFGAAAKQAGFSLEQAAVLASNVQATTDQSGEAVGNKLSKLVSLVSGAPGQSALAQISDALPAGEKIDATATPADQLLELSKIYPKLGEAQRKQLVNTLGGTSATREAITVLNNLYPLVGKNADALTQSGAAAKEFQKRLHDLTVVVRQLQGAAKDIIVNLSQSGLFGPLEVGFGAFAETVKGIDALLQDFNNVLPEGLRKTVFFVGELLAALYAIGKVRQGGGLKAFLLDTEAVINPVFADARKSLAASEAAEKKLAELQAAEKALEAEQKANAAIVGVEDGVVPTPTRTATKASTSTVTAGATEGAVAGVVGGAEVESAARVGASTAGATAAAAVTQVTAEFTEAAVASVEETQALVDKLAAVQQKISAVESDRLAALGAAATEAQTEQAAYYARLQSLLKAQEASLTGQIVAGAAASSEEEGGGLNLGETLNERAIGPEAIGNKALEEGAAAGAAAKLAEGAEEAKAGGKLVGTFASGLKAIGLSLIDPVNIAIAGFLAFGAFRSKVHEINEAIEGAKNNVDDLSNIPGESSSDAADTYKNIAANAAASVEDIKSSTSGLRGGIYKLFEGDKVNNAIATQKALASYANGAAAQVNEQAKQISGGLNLITLFGDPASRTAESVANALKDMGDAGIGVVARVKALRAALGIDGVGTTGGKVDTSKIPKSVNVVPVAQGITNDLSSKGVSGDFFPDIKLPVVVGAGKAGGTYRTSRTEANPLADFFTQQSNLINGTLQKALPKTTTGKGGVLTPKQIADTQAKLDAVLGPQYKAYYAKLSPAEQAKVLTPDAFIAKLNDRAAAYLKGRNVTAVASGDSSLSGYDATQYILNSIEPQYDALIASVKPGDTGKVLQYKKQEISDIKAIMDKIPASDKENLGVAQEELNKAKEDYATDVYSEFEALRSAEQSKAKNAKDFKAIGTKYLTKEVKSNARLGNITNLKAIFANATETEIASIRQLAVEQLELDKVKLAKAKKVAAAAAELAGGAGLDDQNPAVRAAAAKKYADKFDKGIKSAQHNVNVDQGAINNIDTAASDTTFATDSAYTGTSAIEDAQQAALDAAEKQIAKRNAGALTDAPLDGLERAVTDSKTRLDTYKVHDTAYYQELATYNQGKKALADYLANDSANLQEQLGIDLTNPIQTAQAAQDAAKRKLEQAKADAKKGGLSGKEYDDYIAQDTLDYRTSKAATENAKQTEFINSLQTADSLGDISHATYLKYIENEIKRTESKLKGMKKTDTGYYQTQQYLNTLKGDLKSAADEIDSQFNIGDIKIPTPYEVRRAIKAKSTGAVMAENGAFSTGGNVTNDNSQRNVVLNGVPIQQVLTIIQDLFGVKARSIASKKVV
jgi:hypothetical protein